MATEAKPPLTGTQLSPWLIACGFNQNRIAQTRCHRRLSWHSRRDCFYLWGVHTMKGQNAKPQAIIEV